MTVGDRGRTDLRRLYLVEGYPEETVSEATTAAMEEAASLYPCLVVTGVHHIRRRQGGWYAEVSTRMRTRGTWKRTMPTHGETKTRVTTPLDPSDPAEEQLREIRDLSARVLDDPEAMLALVGEPETGDDAATMLEALQTVEAGDEPASDAEAEMVSVINDYLGEPPASNNSNDTDDRSDDGDPPATTPPADATSAAEPPADESLKTCSQCDTPKRLSEFRRDRSSKDGRASACKECRRKADRKAYRRRKEAEKMESKEELDDATAETPQATPQEAGNGTAGRTRNESNGAGDVEDWRRRFVNPTLDQLEHLRAFLGDVSFDETVAVAKQVSGEGDDRG